MDNDTQTKRGRPGRPSADTKALQTIVSGSTAERVKALAQKRGQSVSSLLAQMILLQLDKFERM